MAFNITRDTAADFSVAANIDDTFGPVISQYFDFTRLFEDTILAILPSALFLCVFPLRVSWLLLQPRKVSGSTLNISKIVVLCGFTAFQAACLALWLIPDARKSRASTAAATLSLASAVALCGLSHLEHHRSVRPSPVINTYLLLSLPMDDARVRTAWMRGGSLPLAIACTIAVVIKLFSLLAEAMEKRSILLPRYKGFSPESTSGVYSRGLFYWLNSLLWKGFGSILAVNDLYPVDIGLGTDAIQLQLERGWALRVPLAKAIFPRLCVTFFQYMQPFLISAVIKFLQEPVDSQSTAIGWALTATYGLDFVGIAIANGAFMHQNYRMVTVSRSVIISMIYAQTVDLNLASVDESAAVTLMSADVERICSALQYIHGPWASPLDAIIGAYLLQRDIGLAAVGPGLLSLTFGSIVLYIATRYAPKAQRLWVHCIQTRIDATSKMLGGMKAVKILGLTSLMQHLIQGLREEEVKTALQFRRISVMRLSFGKGSEILAPGIAFAAYAAVCSATGRSLEVSQAYASLNIVSLMTLQLRETIQNLPTIMSAISCFDRIQDYLNLPSQRDHRLRNDTSSQELQQLSRKTMTNGDVELEKLPETVNPRTGSVIRVEDVSLSWVESEQVIKDVSFNLPQHSFTFVVGPVGSGKSTLLKGLVGEVPFAKGFVYSSLFKAGFVDQTSWIQNGTLRSNILGLSAYDMDWYNAVIHAFCLYDDMAVLPKGDRTKVGSAGISLSGGQKQRLALARAVYSKEKLLLLDDCFSGLDATTEDRIFNRLLGRTGLLRRNGTTVVLVTHAAHRLPFADLIIVLDQGRVVEQGTFQHIMDHGKYMPSIIAKFSAQDETHEPVEPAATAGSVLQLEERCDEAAAEVDGTRSAGDWTTYVHYFESCGWLNTIFFCCRLAGFAVFMRMPDVWITYWTAAVQQRGNSVNNYYLGMFLVFEILSALCLVCTGCLVFLRMTPSSSIRQHSIVLDTVMAAPLSFFASTDMGITLKRFSQDMSLVDVEMPPGYLEMAAQVVIVTVQGVLMSLSAGYFAVCIPLVILVMYVLQGFYLRTSRQLRLLDLEAKAPLYSHFVETLEGLVTIRVFGWAKDFERLNARLVEASQKPLYLLYCVQRWLALVLDLTVAGLMIILMVLFVKLRGTIGPGLAGVALVNMSGLSMSLTLLIKAWTTLETSMGAISRVKSFATETTSENNLDETQALPLTWPRNGNIEMIGLTAGYNPDVPVLKNLTLRILAGQKVGICGPSGSGKSSVIATLFRMLEISSGEILIDGLDITRIDRGNLRMHINAIPQDAFLFKGTIRQNLDPFNRCNDEERKSALEKVQLWSALEGKAGLDTPADADIFSHGQRQLFCLARAIFHPSKIVVLDEATSSVDLVTEDLMQKIIREEFRDCTMIAVAHRLDKIMDFDKIATLQAGRLVEFDTPDALMARDSAFKMLYESR